jgi:hypothetical protein
MLLSKQNQKQPLSCIAKTAYHPDCASSYIQQVRVVAGCAAAVAANTLTDVLICLCMHAALLLVYDSSSALLHTALCTNCSQCVSSTSTEPLIRWSVQQLLFGVCNHQPLPEARTDSMDIIQLYSLTSSVSLFSDCCSLRGQYMSLAATVH